MLRPLRTIIRILYKNKEITTSLEGAWCKKINTMTLLLRMTLLYFCTVRHRKFETQISCVGAIIAFKVPPRPVNNATAMRSPVFHIMYQQITAHTCC
jgi:hypothetical protein